MTSGARHPGLFSVPSAYDPDHEQVDVLHVDPGTLRVERIVSRGHSTPADEWYDQDTDEWVALLQGEATIAYGDGTLMTLAPGDWILIPAHRRHRVLSTSSDPPAIWLAVYVLRPQPSCGA